MSSARNHAKRSHRSQKEHYECGSKWRCHNQQSPTKKNGLFKRFFEFLTRRNTTNK